jgi:hypothetical protein
MSATAERRERVFELWGKSDRRISETLIDEGFFGKLPRLAEERSRFKASAKRQVNKDRHWWRRRWKKNREERSHTPAELGMSIDDYVARLTTRIREIEDLIEHPTTKPTAAVNGFSEIRLLEAAIAQAQGIDRPPAAPRDDGDEGDDRPPFLGLILSTGKLSPEAVKKLRGWGNEIEGYEDDDDDDEG